MKIIVTGGLGFIGSNFIDYMLDKYDLSVVNIDCGTYAANPNNISKKHWQSGRHFFYKENICHRDKMAEIVRLHRPKAIVHFAAESHVDNSLENPMAFLETNVLGTASLLDAVRSNNDILGENFRFIHISTDEVYGDLKEDDPPFSEKSHYRPSSPYSASKASSDHVVQSYRKTYGIPAIITHCSNNYGPRQHPEKLIPLVIKNAIECNKIPIYGDGRQIRDWIYVLDHIKAIDTLLRAGIPGEDYCIGGQKEVRNIEVVETLCSIADTLLKRELGETRRLIEHVADRKAHDFRYAVDITKINTQFSWSPSNDFEKNLKETFQWYIERSGK